MRVHAVPPNDGSQIIARTTSLGREVVLRRRSWNRIVGRHPELRGRAASVIETIEMTQERRLDRHRSEREHFYRAGIFRGAWLRVIVDFGKKPASVVHAQRITSIPAGLEQP